MRISLSLSTTVNRDISVSMGQRMRKKVNLFMLRIHKISLNFIERKANSLNSLIKMDGWTKQSKWWGLKEMKGQEMCLIKIGPREFLPLDLKSTTKTYMPKSPIHLQSILRLWANTQQRKCKSEPNEMVKHSDSVLQSSLAT